MNLPTTRDAFWSRTPGKPPRIFAHRGNGSSGFENTISSYIFAAHSGVDGIEIDVSYTSDGKLVCFHDDTLKRISGGRQPLRDTTFRTLRSIPLEGNERIPLLEEAFEALPSSVAVILDIKTCGIMDRGMIGAVRAFLKRTAFEDQRLVSVTSFNYVALRLLARSAPDLRTGFILRADSAHTRLGMASFFSKDYKAVHPQAPMVTRKLVTAWHKAGLDVIPWTVDERMEAIKLAGDGVDGIITDQPASIREAVQ
jgi:glycerophosphoryl diester phosphodiesterase